MPASYEQDFFAWTQHQANALRQAGKGANAGNLDWQHLANEIESLGRREQNEVVSYLCALLLHLLKWQFQPSLHGNGWRYSILEQRRKIERLLKQNPSLKSRLDELIGDAYGDAIIDAARETGLAIETFPKECSYTFPQMMDPAHPGEWAGDSARPAGR
jgi:hypothetical protein